MTTPAAPLFFVCVVALATVVGLLAWRVYCDAPVAGRLRLAGFALFPWLIGVALLCRQDAFADLTSFPNALGFAIAIPPITVLALLRNARFRAMATALPDGWLVGVQLYRVIGVLFLLAAAAGTMPLAVAVPTGIMDVLVGVSAPFVARQLVRRDDRRLAVAWNVLGLADFAFAVPLVLFSLPNVLQLISLTPPPVAIGLLPLSFIAAFAMPLAISLHMLSLVKLLRVRPAAAPRPTSASASTQARPTL